MGERREPPLHRFAGVACDPRHSQATAESENDSRSHVMEGGWVVPVSRALLWG